MEKKMKFKLASSLSILLFSLNGLAENINIKAKDGFNLSASYIESSTKSSKGVLMLHQCNEDKNMYNNLAKSLAKQGIHSLAIDFRGYGESVDDKYSLKLMREKATSRENYTAGVREMRTEHWPSDTIAAYKTLKNKIGSDNISFIGASCGGVQSIILAKKHQPKSFTFFSSGMNDTVLSDFAKMSHIPALIIASQGDKYTFNSSNKVFLGAKSEQTKLLSYKGRGHGLPLFKQDPKLEGVMVDWFKLRAK